MNTKSILKTFVKYVSLNVIAMIGLSCYILADTFFIANGVGVDGLTALNLAIPVYSVINGGGLMIGIGGATKYAIFRAQDQEREGNAVFSHALVFGISIGIILLITGIFFSAGLSRLLGSDEVTFSLTNIYLKTVMCFSPMFIVNNILVAFIRNDGAPNLAMAAMLSGSISNIVLDYLFVYPLGMGMFGAALATGTAPVVGIVVISGYFLKKKNQFHLIKCRLKMEYIRVITVLGTASFITEVSSGIVIIVFNIIILKLNGNLGVAAYGIIANLALVATSMFTGIAQGIQPIISSNYGARNYDNIKKTVRYAVITSIVFAVLIYLVTAGFAAPIAGIFNKERNLQLSALAVQGLRIYFIGFFFAGLNIIFASWFSSVEKAMQSFTISILRGCVIIIPLLLILSSASGLAGVWLTYPVTEVLTLIVGVFIIMFLKKTNINLDKSNYND